MLNRDKGFEYEVQVRDFLNREKQNIAWLWSDVPITNLIESKIIDCHSTYRLIRKNNKENPLIDTGIDVILYNGDNQTYKLIQCKNGYSNGLRMSDLAGFYGWMSS